jgi:hypothetical protein
MASIGSWFKQRITEYYSTVNNWLSTTATSFRVQTTRALSRLFAKPSTDWSRADYDFWKRAYYCRVRGMEMSGLFIKPLVNKISAWTLGRAPNWKLDNEELADGLSSWWDDHHAQILQADRLSRKLGDQFIVVNPDLSLTLVSPELVEPMVSDDDYGEIIGWRITQTKRHPYLPTESMVMIDEYYDDHRIHVVEKNGAEISRESYANLIGMSQVVHIANMPDDNMFGHPEAEALVEILQRYNTTLQAGLEGNEIQGRPTPVLSFDSVQDMDAFWNKYGVEETQELANGEIKKEVTLEVDLYQILTISNAKFSYESPGQFAGDTEKLLGLLFYLILENTEIPEFVFGNAIASSQASAQAQMPIWIRYIEGRQTEASGWLTQLARIVVAFLILLQPALGGLSSDDEKPLLQWAPLGDDDGNLVLATLEWLYLNGMIDDRTAVMLAPVGIEDIDAVLDAAAKQRESMEPDNGSPLREDAIDDAMAKEIARLESE